MQSPIKLVLLAGAVLLALNQSASAQTLTATPEGDGTINFAPNPNPFLGEDQGNPLSSGNQSDNSQQIGIMKFQLPTLTAGQTFTNASFSFDFIGTYQSPGGSETNSVSIGVYQPSNSDTLSSVTNTDYTESLGATTISANLVTPTSPTGVFTITNNANLNAAIAAAYTAGDTSIALSFTTPIQSGDTDVYFFETDTGTDPGTSQPSLLITEAVPEPSSLSLIAIGIGFMMFRRFRQAHQI